MNPLIVSIIQNDAGHDVDQNLAHIRDLVSYIDKTDIIVLPELFAMKSSHEAYRGMAEHIPGPLTEFVSSLAKETGAWILGGSIIEKIALVHAGKEELAYYNTSILVNREGQLHAVYRKIHLFEARLEDGEELREADLYQAGTTPVWVNLEEWGCGLSICYDLRFPELYRVYAGHDVHLLFIPSNFTWETGRDHWEVLVRARAIENQCFVVASNQCGTNHDNGVASYGHSMIIDPWGEVLAIADEQESILSVKLDPELMREARSRIPAVYHRKL